jgi:large subunit ribosomal protein L33
MLKISLLADPAEKKAEKQRKNQVEVEVVRTKITLACTECKQRNYNMTKDKKTHPDRMETKKYCRFCKTHTLHKETK